MKLEARRQVGQNLYLIFDNDCYRRSSVLMATCKAKSNIANKAVFTCAVS